MEGCVKGGKEKGRLLWLPFFFFFCKFAYLCPELHEFSLIIRANSCNSGQNSTNKTNKCVF
jgi:hypothetical protein